jgi:hypothetical protein
VVLPLAASQRLRRAAASRLARSLSTLVDRVAEEHSRNDLRSIPSPYGAGTAAASVARRRLRVGVLRATI